MTDLPEPAAMADVSLFAGLSSQEMGSIFDLATTKEFAEGAEVVHEGDPGDSFYLISSGEAKVVVGGAVRRTLGPGDYFGEISLIDGGPRAATVIADSPLKTLAVTTRDFQRLLENNPTIVRKLLAAMAALARNTADQES